MLPECPSDNSNLQHVEKVAEVFSIDNRNLLALAERCEAATADDALQLINLECDICAALGIDPSGHESPYTASLDAAMTLVPDEWAIERLADTTSTIAPWQTGPWVVQLSRFVDPVRREYAASENGSTPSLALCAAALRARAAA